MAVFVMVLGLVMVFGIIGIGILVLVLVLVLVFWYHCGGVYARKKRCHWTAASEREIETEIKRAQMRKRERKKLVHLFSLKLTIN